MEKYTTDNPYPETYETASEHLRYALSFLAERNLPPSPLNLRIGYDYAAGRDEGLMKAVDQVSVGNVEISNDRFWGIYQQFFSHTDQIVESLRTELHRIVSQVKSEFERGAGNLATYLETLGKFSEILDRSKGAPVGESDVHRIVSATQKTERSQSGLAGQLSGVMSEIEILRKELEQVRQESRIDALTGICNRKGFDTYLEQLIHETRKNKSVFAVLLIDIDHFKRFNDAYGHLVGDKVLRFVASTMKRAVKGGDFAARFGGEEFAIILPNTKIAGALTVAEQVRKSISAGQLKDVASGETYGQITASIGVAEIRMNDLPHDLIQRADRALYLAKERGRNRVGHIL